MDIARLRDVQSRERTTDSLQELSDSFYADVAEYIAELKAERERAADDADDPFADPDVSRLTDEIETAEQVAESIYERRVGKIVKQASFAAAGMGGADDGLTAEEQDLYDDLVERIEENKTRVLDVLAGETKPAPDSEEPDGDGTGVDAAALMGDTEDDPLTAETGTESLAAPGGERDDAGQQSQSEPDGSPSPDDAPEPPEPAADGPESAAADGETAEGDVPPGRADGGEPPEAERETVRITQDVGEIFGVDERTYTLESEDVVTLPEVNAGALVERDAAEKLE